ncbi:DNA cytosine methyltransferase [Streptomyces sp. NPDC051555]|uniref:DNA cytosine methyltransferase n=1 Tax=Streptomyces sp. NPDC051555 TaxID=3365657 RepID=UPI00379ACB19
MAPATTNHLFAGGGGDLEGFRAAGARPRSAFNHAQPAVETIRLNFRGVHAQCENIHALDMRKLPHAQVLVGSPICTEAAPAGGNSAPRLATLDDAVEEADTDAVEPDDLQTRPKDWSQTRATAFDLIRAEECGDYDIVCGENVPGFATRWRLFDDWLRIWDTLGKTATLVSFDAAHLDGDDFTAPPQHRHRIAFAFTRKGLPKPDLRPRPRAVCPHCGEVRGMQQWARPRMRKTATYGEGYRYVCPNRRCGHLEATPLTRPIGDAIDPTAPTRRFGDGKPGRRFRPYATTTRDKVEAGLRQFDGKPFLVILRNHSTVQSLDEAAPAFTAEGNHHMFIEPAGTSLDDCRVRMFTNREKARGQGFPDSHEFAGTATEVNRQIGNAFPPTSARWLAERLLEVLP